MAILNAVLGAVVDVVLRPLAGLPQLASLALISLVVAVAMLLVVRRTSNQPALERVKRNIHAALFEIRLFNDDMRAIFRAQGEMLRHNLTYLRLSLAPMVWMVIPFVLLVAQLQFQYGYDGLEPGRAVLLTVHVRSDAPGPAVLEPSAAVRVDEGAIWFPAARELVWRLTPRAAGDHELRIRLGDRVFTKTLHVSSGLARRSPSRLEAGFVNQLLYPAEPPLPHDAPVTAMTVAYPEHDLDVLGWSVNWLVVFFVLSMAFAFALRKPFKVTL